MAGSGYRVNFDGMRQVVEEIAQINNQVIQQLENLRQEVNRVAPSWDGDAKATWEQVDRLWQQQCQAMSQKLTAMQRFVDSSTAQMVSTEAANASLMGQ